VTIPVDGAGGFFTRLGKIGGTMQSVYTHLAAGDIGGHIDDVFAEYVTGTDQDVVDTIFATLAAYRASPSQFLSAMQALGNATILAMANDDSPLPTQSVPVAIAYLINQMLVNSETLERPTIAVGSATYPSTNVGNGAIVASVLNNDGAFQPYVFNEDATCICTADATTGATAGSETFSLTTPAAVDPLAWDWEAGSGVSSTLTSVNPALDASGGNLLTNSDFNTFTGAVPDSWTATVATGIASGGSGNAYAGSNCLAISYDASAPLSELRQAVTVTPLTAYTFRVLMKKTAGLSGAGAIRLALVNASGTVLTDPQGNACSATFTLSGFTTGYVAKTLTTWTPRTLSGTTYLQIKITTAIADASQSVYVDWGAMNAMTRLYTGGPLVSLFSGSTNWALNDRVVQPFTNDYAGLFIRLVDRVFNCRTQGLVFPTDASPSIPDSLIG